MRLSIILTVFDRSPLVLTNTFAAIAKNQLEDCEVLVVNDGSTQDYTELREMVSEWGMPLTWINASTVEAKPKTYHIGGHNNPAFVNNLAIAEAKGDILLWLSSDTIIPPHTVSTILMRDVATRPWSACVMDIDTGMQWCGPTRIFPMCWALACSREMALQVGGFDEKYIEGMAFEDNDFVGRLALHAGRFQLDQSVVVFHQSHPKTYLDDGGTGYEISEAYTVEKWGGIPWGGTRLVPDAKIVDYAVSEVGQVLLLRCRPGKDCKLKEAVHV